MATYLSEFRIKGTLDNMEFYNPVGGKPSVRSASKKGVTKEQFASNPVFDEIKKHNTDFGQAVKLARGFRMLVKPFFDRAKDLGFAGRANALLFDIIASDTVNERGQKKAEIGWQKPEVHKFPLGFEGNKTRPLKKVVHTKFKWNTQTHTLEMEIKQPETDFDWPEKATHLHLAIAVSDWNLTAGSWETCYSEEITIAKTEKPQKITLTAESPESQNWVFGWIFIGFSEKTRRTLKPLKRSHNTVTLYKVYPKTKTKN